MSDASLSAPLAFDTALAAQAGGALSLAATQSGRAMSPDQADRVAKDFEKFFLAKSFESMQAGLKTDGPFGGGEGERAWRSFLNEAMADAVVSQGGIGLADSVRAQLVALQTQEAV